MNFDKRIEARLFEAACEIADDSERRAFLNQTCHGDSELRARIEKLVALHGRAEGFFDLPSPKVAPPPVRTTVIEGPDAGFPDTASPENGARFGHFKVVRRIGEGGCGVVYLAEQLEPVHREVALKIIRLGMDTEAVIARFERERQALSLMEHPNIARVLDAGTTSTGRPYFVMELVRGKQIVEFCRLENVSLHSRLELFVRVCNAIQHAHQKGVIHRDIKPTNVLVRTVDGEPHPKVIDFGIAKEAAGRVGTTAIATQSGQFLGTPAYMSPEQAVGSADVDTRSDIYSLGALLYELVCGVPPFDPARLSAAGALEAQRIICEETPKPPSAISGKKTHAELDWIVAKAMAGQRNNRYDTANGLALDVRRFLEGEPVVAAPPRRSYRLAKLIRRNRVTFLSGSVAVLALLVGLGVSTRLYFREKRATEEQVRLRSLAEEARNNEARLRTAADYRNLAAQAAVLLRYKDLEGADRLLSSIPGSETPYSLEAGDAFRKVADWHLSAGRWHKAAERYTSMVRAVSNADGSDNDLVSRSLLYAATAVCHVGDDAGYRRIREFAILRFAHTTHPVVAEQVLKVCLLKPADESLLRELRPLADIVGTNLGDESSPVRSNSNLMSWGRFAMALFHYRCGDYHEAADWTHRCLDSQSPNGARDASSRLILAMIERQMGREEAAREFIDLVSGPVIEQTGRIRGTDPTQLGSWYAWVTARILLREARAGITTP